jgi:hypothetical protein
VREILSPIFKFILLILLQVTVLKELELGAANWWITPFVYILFILELPVKIAPITILLSAMGMGLIIDVFYDSLGFHASAAVFVAFLRFYVLRLLIPKDGFDPNASPLISSIGGLKYATYIFTMLLCYHLWFFIVEIFRFSDFFVRFGQAIISAVFATIICVVIHLIFQKQKRK